MDDDRVVIIIPAHNEAHFIGNLLRSVRAHGPAGTEVVVIDNGSDDYTAGIAENLDAKVLRVPRKFPGTARNIGARTSDAGVIVFLDADVELTEDWARAFNRCRASLKVDPAQLFGSIYDVSRNPSWIERVWFAPMRARKRWHVDGGNIIVSRQLYDALGGFDEQLETGEDVDLCARAIASKAAVRLDPGLRVHHEGYPKTLLRFMKRERWHGKGDLVSLRQAATSKVFAASVLTMALSTLCLLSLGFGYWIAGAACAIAILGLCAAGARRVANVSWIRLPIALPVIYAYYLGRFLSVFDALAHMRRRHR